MKHISVLGNAGVGKTNYINKIVGRPFERRYIPTFGIQKIIHNNITYYDYAGQEIYTPTCDSEGIKGIDEFWIIYWSDEKMSFTDVPKWIDKARHMCGTKPKITVYKNEIKKLIYVFNVK